MIKRKKLLFYPYNHLSYGLVRGILLNDEYIDIAAPEGTGLIDKDIAYVVNRNEIKKTVKSIKEIEYKNYDKLIISSNTNFSLCKNEIAKIINNCKKNDIEILYLGENKEINRLLQSNNQSSLKSFQIMKKIEVLIKRYNQLNLPIYTPKTPIVYIGGILETIDSFDISLQIKFSMEKLGYEVSMITRQLDGNLFGAVNYPNLFIRKDGSIENQIRLINRQIQAIDYLEKPDIILLDIPEGMIQYSNSFHNEFGIYTYMIGKTIAPDYLILTVPSTLVAEEYIKDINQYFEGTIGQSIDRLNITNGIYDIGPETTIIIDKPLYIPEKDIDKIILEMKDKSNFNITNLNRQENIDATINHIITKFS